MWKPISASYALYNFSCIRIYKTPEDVSQMEAKHVAVNKLLKLALCVADLIFMVVTGLVGFVQENRALR